MVWLFCTSSCSQMFRLTRDHFALLALALWVAWLAVFAGLRDGLASVPYSLLWRPDCHEVELANAARLAASQQALERLSHLP